MYSIFLPLSLPPPSIAAAARRRMQVKALSFLQLRRLDKVANFFFSSASPPCEKGGAMHPCRHYILYWVDRFSHSPVANLDRRT